MSIAGLSGWPGAIPPEFVGQHLLMKRLKTLMKNNSLLVVFRGTGVWPFNSGAIIVSGGGAIVQTTLRNICKFSH